MSGNLRKVQIPPLFERIPKRDCLDSSLAPHFRECADNICGNRSEVFILAKVYSEFVTTSVKLFAGVIYLCFLRLHQSVSFCCCIDHRVDQIGMCPTFGFGHQRQVADGRHAGK